MAKKEKVELIRPDEFEQVDQELEAAMASLDAMNHRVVELLQTPGLPATANGDMGEVADTPRMPAADREEATVENAADTGKRKSASDEA